jgi:organic hydroperoxide reductase OsmC/OhrA
MQISASIKNSDQQHHIVVSTEGNEKVLAIPAKAEGYGSSVNGGELLFLSLATCFCNDIYREAAKRKMEISLVEVKVSGEFGKEGEPGSNISYEAKVESVNSSTEEIEALVEYVDGIAEIHNTLRKGVEVRRVR